MRLIFMFLIGFLTIFPLGCTFSPNPVNWFKSVPEEERFTRHPSETPAEETQQETVSGLETVEEALVGPETPEEALVHEPMEGAVVAEEAPRFIIVYYAGGPAGRARASAADKPEPSAVYERAKKAHMAHNLEEGVYAPYYQHIRNRIKSHWNFLYGNIDGISYTTRNSLPIIVDAKVYNTGLISDLSIVDTAGNPVLAAIVKGAIETALLDRFFPEIKDEFLRLRFQFYFGE
ncbi:MAG: hypothetical protein ACE5IC_09665 [Candidatus Brocadiales bacterium]